jgi:Cu-Zn family superoxide dismutase
VRHRIAIVLAFTAALDLSAGGALAQTPGTSAELRDAGGKVVGSATFSQAADGVRIAARFQGLPPGPHGIHVHAVGTCEPPGFTSAGGHFNPIGKKHGLKSPEGAHAGDLPNLTVAADGTGSIDVVARGATIGAGPASVFDGDGSALVVHAGPDDDLTDPAGNSGARIACGVLAQRAIAPAQLPRTGGLGAALPLLAAGALLASSAVLRRLRR